MMNSHKLIRFKSVTLCHILLCSAVFIILTVFEHTAHAEPKDGIKNGDEWHYFKGKTKPPKKWNHHGFDDAAWQKGRTPIGYGTDKLNTSLPSPSKMVWVDWPISLSMKMIYNPRSLSIWEKILPATLLKE